MTCVRDQIHGPRSTTSSPASSRSSRASACSCVSPGSSPPPGAAQTLRAGKSNRTSRTRSAGSRTTARAACRSLIAGSRRTPGTSAAARTRGPRRSRAMSRGARRALSRRGDALAARAPGARRTLPGRPPCRRSRSPSGRSSTAIRSSRSAEPAKSARLRSPEPGVVRYAALVAPMPSFSSSNCSLGS